MELLVLDNNLKALSTLDTYESLIWVNRYCGYGEFEIYVKVSETLLDILKEDNYILELEGRRVMVIEDQQIIFDTVEGDYMIVTGRSLESILDRRVVLDRIVIKGHLQTGIQRMLDKNIGVLAGADRTISNFIFEESTNPEIVNMPTYANFELSNLYESIRVLCESRGVGFQVTLSEDVPFSLNKFIFKLTLGENRSYSQTENPFVVFSKDFDNLISNHYSKSKRALRTVTYSAGSGEGDDRTIITVYKTNDTGINRRELYTDASSIQKDNPDDVEWSEADYAQLLAQKGYENLLEFDETQVFDCDLQHNSMYKYGEDFFLGDLVQVVSSYGIEATAQVTEIIYSESQEGITIIPKFKILN